MRQNIANALVSIDYFLKHNEDESIILVQFHSSTTAEKNTMLHFLDGKVAAVIGTHTKGGADKNLDFLCRKEWILRMVKYAVKDGEKEYSKNRGEKIK